MKGFAWAFWKGTLKDFDHEEHKLIKKEDLSLSIKSAGHKTQLLVGQTNMPATSQEYWQLGILEER